LREVLQHRVRSVAEERDAAFVPILGRRPVPTAPTFFRIDVLEQGAPGSHFSAKQLVQWAGSP
jgi:hypothetical protein